MSKYQLDVQLDYDFQVIAISSNQKAHTLCWEINKTLDSKLEITDYYEFRNKSAIVEYKKYKSENAGFVFDLLCNKSQNNRLLSELPTVDYFIKFYDDESPYSAQEIVHILRKSKLIQAVYSLDVTGLKSKQVFIFE